MEKQRNRLSEEELVSSHGVPSPPKHNDPNLVHSDGQKLDCLMQSVTHVHTGSSDDDSDDIQIIEDVPELICLDDDEDDHDSAKMLQHASKDDKVVGGVSSVNLEVINMKVTKTTTGNNQQVFCYAPEVNTLENEEHMLQDVNNKDQMIEGVEEPEIFSHEGLSNLLQVPYNGGQTIEGADKVSPDFEEIAETQNANEKNLANSTCLPEKSYRVEHDEIPRKIRRLEQRSRVKDKFGRRRREIRPTPSQCKERHVILEENSVKIQLFNNNELSFLHTKVSADLHELADKLVADDANVSVIAKNIIEIGTTLLRSENSFEKSTANNVESMPQSSEQSTMQAPFTSKQNLDEAELIRKQISNVAYKRAPLSRSDKKLLTELKQRWSILQTDALSTELKDVSGGSDRCSGFIPLIHAERLIPCPRIYTACDRVSLFSGGVNPQNMLGRSNKLSNIFNNVMKFIERNLNKIYSSPRRRDFWQSITILTNDVNKAMVIIECHLDDFTWIKTLDDLYHLAKSMKNYFRGYTLIKDIVSVILKIPYKDRTHLWVLYGVDHLSYAVNGLRIKVYDDNLLWANPHGTVLLCSTILKLANIDNMCGILQLGLINDIISLKLAKECREMHVLDSDSVSGCHLLENARHNNVKTIHVNTNFKHKDFQDVLHNKLSTCQRIVVVLCGLNDLKEYMYIDLLRNQKIEKLVVIMEQYQQADVNKLAQLCNRNHVATQPFIIFRVVPVDTAWHDHNVKLVYLLSRSNTRTSSQASEPHTTVRTSSNSKNIYKRQSIEACREDSASNFESHITQRKIPLEPCHTTNIDRLAKIAQTQLEKNFPISISDIEPCTVSQTGNQLQCGESNVSSNLVEDMSLYDQIISAVYCKGPITSNLLQHRFSLKQDWVLSEAKCLSSALKTKLPNIALLQNEELLFFLHDLIGSSSVIVPCQKFEVFSTLDPSTSMMMMTYRIKSNGFAVPVDYFHLDVFQKVYEKLLLLIIKSGLQLYNPKTKSGVWKRILVCVNEVKQFMITVICETNEKNTDVSQKILTVMRSHKEQFQSIQRPEYELVSFVLRLESRNSVTIPLIGDGFLTYNMKGLNVRVHALSPPWPDTSAVEELTYTVMEMVKPVDKTWSIVQFGFGYIFVSLYLAEISKKVFVFDMLRQQGDALAAMAEENDVNNITIINSPLTNKNISKILKQASDEQSSSVCVFINESHAMFNFLYLRNCSKVKKIVWIAELSNKAMFEKLCILCKKETCNQAPFVIVSATPVDMSPYENDVKTIYVLIRESSTVKHTGRNDKHVRV